MPSGSGAVSPPLKSTPGVTPVSSRPGTGGAAAAKKVDPKSTGTAAESLATAAAAATAAPLPHLLAGSVLTSLALSFSLSAPLAPASEPLPPLSVSDFIPSRNAAPVGVARLDASSELRRELANAVAIIAREMAAASDDGAALSALSEKGALDAMREALKTVAARLVREKFAGLPGASDAPGPEGGRDAFTAALLDHMLGHLNAVLNATAAEAKSLIGEGGGGEGGGEELGKVGQQQNSQQHTTIPDSSSDALSLTTATTLNEPPLVRLRRIADEAEFSGAFARAARVHSTRVALAESAAAAGATNGAYDSGVWTDMGLFYTRRGTSKDWWPKALTCFREALSCDATSPRASMALSALLLARGEAADAEVFASAAARELSARATRDAAQQKLTPSSATTPPPTPSVSEAANALPLALTLAALAAGAAGADARAAAALLDAVRALASVLTVLGASAGDVARGATPGSVYLIAARASLDAGLHTLARRALSLAVAALIDTDAPRVQRADAAALRARRFAVAVGATLPRARADYSDADAATRAAGGVARVLNQTKAAAANNDDDDDDVIAVNPDADKAALEAMVASDVASGPASKKVKVLRSVIGDADAVSPHGGVAYDGAITTAEEAERTVKDALALSELCGEAWDVSSQLWSAGLIGARHRDRICGTDIPLPRGGAPELGDVDAVDLIEAARRLRLAISTHAPPLHGATCAAALDGTAPPMLVLPANFPAPAASAPFAPAPASTPSRADSALASSSGVGGGLIFAPRSYLQRLYLRLAATQLQLAAAEVDEGRAVLTLANARDSFARAVGAGRADETAAASSSTASSPGVCCGPWASSWLGLGRALWAQGDATDAEAAFGEANALDNGHAATWAWLAHLCASTGTGREREASAALNEALKAVS
jgi:tetratricopeptide (TPR) repeat protein